MKPTYFRSDKILLPTYLAALILLIGLFYPPLSLANTAGTSPPNPSKELISAVKTDLSRRTKIPIANLQVKNTTSRTWPDGCLGLGKPDEICTQALVPGWQITLSDNKTTWIYRTDRTGRNIRPAAR